MYQSRLFTKTLRSLSEDETSANAQLLIRGGYVQKLMAGVYSYLPLGWRVLKNIENIIREEMDAIGGEELFMPALQPKEIWEKTGRWATLRDIMFRLVPPNAGEPSTGLATTHEEAVTELARQFISSYKDLPKYVYQIQTKFRNEPRPKSGLIRLREFAMKDLYSFHASEADLDRYYEDVKEAYLKIFRRCDLDAKVVEASGGTFTRQYSHEFQVVSDAGEDRIVHCRRCAFAQNAEIAAQKAGGRCPSCGGDLVEARAIEVGNIFKLGTKFSEAFGLAFADKDGSKKPVIMASYGIGPGRVMATIVERHHDEHGIIWPDAVAPFRAHLIGLSAKDGKKAVEIRKTAGELYTSLQREGLEVLYDDREDISAGEKFADADLLGMPMRIVVSEKTLDKDSAELKRRDHKETTLVELAGIAKALKGQGSSKNSVS